MNRDLLAVLNHYERDKGIDRHILIETIKSAILTAAKKRLDEKEEDLRVEMDEQTADIKIFLRNEELPATTFGRIAAQTAKQVLIQKLNEAERDVICKEFADKVGTVVTGMVEQEDSGAVFVDLGKAAGVIPSRDRSPSDHYRSGARIKCYVSDVQRTPKGVQIILSRAHPHLVREMFETQVPEIVDGIVKIIGVAREPGYRTKMGVHSDRSDVDCIGACVGIKGSRVKSIVQELGGEKIDITPFDANPVVYITRALSPAQVGSVKLNEAERSAEVIVEPDQLSLAIGKKGLNVKLASKLTGWRIDIRSKEQVDRVRDRLMLEDFKQIPGVDESVEKALKDAGYQTVQNLLSASEETLAGLPGVGSSLASQIKQHVASLADPRFEQNKPDEGQEQIPSNQAPTE